MSQCAIEWGLQAAQRDTPQDFPVRPIAENVFGMLIVTARRTADVNQKQELAFGLWPEGLAISMKNGFFEPSNLALMDSWRT